MHYTPDWLSSENEGERHVRVHVRVSTSMHMYGSQITASVYSALTVCYIMC